MADFPIYKILQGFTNDSHVISQRNSPKYFWKSSVTVTFTVWFLAQRVTLKDFS